MWKLKQPDTTFLFNQINSLTLAIDLIFLFWIIQVTLGAHSLSLIKWNKPVNLQLCVHEPVCVHDPVCSCFRPLIPKLFDLLTCRWCLMWAVGPEYCPCSLPGQGPKKSLQLTNQKSSIRLWTLSGKSPTPFEGISCLFPILDTRHRINPFVQGPQLTRSQKHVSIQMTSSWHLLIWSSLQFFSVTCSQFFRVESFTSTRASALYVYLQHSFHHTPASKMHFWLKGHYKCYCHHYASECLISKTMRFAGEKKDIFNFTAHWPAVGVRVSMQAPSQVPKNWKLCRRN